MESAIIDENLVLKKQIEDYEAKIKEKEEENKDLRRRNKIMRRDLEFAQKGKESNKNKT